MWINKFYSQHSLCAFAVLNFAFSQLSEFMFCHQSITSPSLKHTMEEIDWLCKSLTMWLQLHRTQKKQKHPLLFIVFISPCVLGLYKQSEKGTQLIQNIRKIMTGIFFTLEPFLVVSDKTCSEDFPYFSIQHCSIFYSILDVTDINC